MCKGNLFIGQVSSLDDFYKWNKGFLLGNISGFCFATMIWIRKRNNKDRKFALNHSKESLLKAPSNAALHTFRRPIHAYRSSRSRLWFLSAEKRPGHRFRFRHRCEHPIPKNSKKLRILRIVFLEFARNIPMQSQHIRRFSKFTVLRSILISNIYKSDINCRNCIQLFA